MFSKKGENVGRSNWVRSHVFEVDFDKEKCLEGLYGGNPLGLLYKNWCLVVFGRRCYRTFGCLSFNILPSETIGWSYDYQENDEYFLKYKPLTMIATKFCMLYYIA